MKLVVKNSLYLVMIHVKNDDSNHSNYEDSDFEKII